MPLAECVALYQRPGAGGYGAQGHPAGVPALVSKSMPTVQSLELAEEYGLKLFIRQKK